MPSLVYDPDPTPLGRLPAGTPAGPGRRLRCRPADAHHRADACCPRSGEGDGGEHRRLQQRGAGRRAGTGSCLLDRARPEGLRSGVGERVRRRHDQDGRRRPRHGPGHRRDHCCRRHQRRRGSGRRALRSRRPRRRRLPRQVARSGCSRPCWTPRSRSTSASSPSTSHPPR